MCNNLKSIGKFPPHQCCYEHSPLIFTLLHSSVIVYWTDFVYFLSLRKCKAFSLQRAFSLHTSDGALRVLAVFIHYQTHLIGRWGKKVPIQLQTNISITKCTSYITLTGESRLKGLLRRLLKSLPSPISMIFETHISNRTWSSAKNGAHKIILCEKSTKNLCNRLSLFRYATCL